VSEGSTSEKRAGADTPDQLERLVDEEGEEMAQQRMILEALITFLSGGE
jgi:hypothetical protein